MTKKNERAGHCFQLAGSFVVSRSHKGEEWKLVHGLVKSKTHGLIYHAWAERDDKVWEPEFDKVWDAKEFYLYVGWVKEEYTVKQTILLQLRTKHFGPYLWEDRQAVGVVEVDAADILARLEGAKA